MRRIHAPWHEVLESVEACENQQFEWRRLRESGSMGSELPQALVVRLAKYVEDTAELGYREMPSAQPFQFSMPHRCEAHHDAGLAHGLLEHGRAGGRKPIQQVRGWLPPGRSSAKAPAS